MVASSRSYECDCSNYADGTSWQPGSSALRVDEHAFRRRSDDAPRWMSSVRNENNSLFLFVMFGRLFGRKCELETSAVRLRDRTASSRITKWTIILIKNILSNR